MRLLGVSTAAGRPHGRGRHHVSGTTLTVAPRRVARRPPLAASRFIRSEEKGGLCSKCYRDQMREQQSGESRREPVRQTLFLWLFFAPRHAAGRPQAGRRLPGPVPPGAPTWLAGGRGTELPVPSVAAARILLFLPASPAAAQPPPPQARTRRRLRLPPRRRRGRQPLRLLGLGRRRVRQVNPSAASRRSATAAGSAARRSASSASSAGASTSSAPTAGSRRSTIAKWTTSPQPVRTWKPSTARPPFRRLTTSRPGISAAHVHYRLVRGACGFPSTWISAPLSLLAPPDAQAARP